VLTGLLVAAVLALYASIVLSVGNPIHGFLFKSTHGGHDLPIAYHILRDGMLALFGNDVLAVTFVGAVLSSRWLAALRRPRLSAAAAS
jgi:hypothetical protein